MTRARAEYLAVGKPQYGTSGSADALIRQHAELVKRIAYHLVSRLPASVDVDDLIQAGMIGLLEAAKHYDDSMGASFETYAGIRVRGAMLDEVRKADWAPRSVHRRAREAAEAIREIEHRTGREASEQDVAAALKIPIAEYQQIVQDAARCPMFSLSGAGSDEDDGRTFDAPDPNAGPGERLESEEFQSAMAKAIAELPEREKLVMSLYYDEEMNLREIGQVLSVTESRVCQIHGQALVRLKARLADFTQ